MKKSSKFIVVGHARSGTTITHYILREHSNVSALWDEVDFTPFYDKGLSVFTHGLDKEEEKIIGYKKIFDALISINSNENTKAEGLKTAINKPEGAIVFKNTVASYLKDVKIIYVFRDNLTAQYGSFIRAVKTGSWHSWQKDLKTQNPKFKVNKSEFIKYIIKSIEINKTLKELSSTNDFLEVVYERDILPNKIENFHKVFEFLGLPLPDYDFPLSKIAPEPHEFLINYNELIKIEKEIKESFKNDNIQKWNKYLKNSNESLFVKIKNRIIYNCIKFLKSL